MTRAMKSCSPSLGTRTSSRCRRRRGLWRLLDSPRTLLDLTQSLATEHAGPTENVSVDVEELPNELVERGLVEAVSNGEV